MYLFFFKITQYDIFCYYTKYSHHQTIKKRVTFAHNFRSFSQSMIGWNHSFWFHGQTTHDREYTAEQIPDFMVREKKGERGRGPPHSLFQGQRLEVTIRNLLLKGSTTSQYHHSREKTISTQAFGRYSRCKL